MNAKHTEMHVDVFHCLTHPDLETGLSDSDKQLQRQGHTLNITLTAALDGSASSMINTPSVVILTPSRHDVKVVQPSETERQQLHDAFDSATIL